MRYEFCIHLKLGGCIASEESGKESWVVKPLIEGSIGDGSITQQLGSEAQLGGGDLVRATRKRKWGPWRKI